MFLPREGFERWAVISADRFAQDRGYWQNVERTVGDSPSALRFIVPENFPEEEGDARKKVARAAIYDALECECVEKLNRGFILVERTTKYGRRRGILACIDLEEYTMSEGECSQIRPSQQFDRRRAQQLADVRSQLPLEFPCATVFYRDKKNKIMRGLGDDLEEVYRFDLMLGGGEVCGYFIPEFVATEVAEDMHTRGEPCFSVADGECEIAAAKLHWENLKKTLKKQSLARHPARFALVEMVNIYDDGAVLEPLHRLLCEIEREPFLDFFAKNVKCKRKGNILYPQFRDRAEATRRTDEVISEYLRRNGGRVLLGGEEILKRADEEDCAAVALGPIDKEDLFDDLKNGELLPQNTFRLGAEGDARFYLEGREISYD